MIATIRSATDLLVMIAATIWVYYCISKLDVNPNPISFLDDMLLLICLPSIFLYCGLNLVAAGAFNTYRDQYGNGNDDIPNLFWSLPTNILMVCL